MELDVRKLVITFLFFGLVLFLSYQLLKDPPLKCAIPSAHNKSRLHINLVYSLTANGNLILDVPPRKAFSRRNPIVSCMTTTASRVAKLQPVLLSVAKQRPAPYAIVLAPDASVPWPTVERAAANWNELAASGAPIKIVKMPDALGPNDKVWACLRYAEHASLPPSGVLVVSDDDYLRGSGWLASLSSRALLQPKPGLSGPPRLVSFELPAYASSLRVRGSNGYAALYSSFGTASEFYAFALAVEESCRCMDDVEIVGYMRGVRSCAVHNRVLDEPDFWRTKGLMAAGLQTKGSLHLTMSGPQRQRWQRACVRAMRTVFPGVPDVLATDDRT